MVAQVPNLQFPPVNPVSAGPGLLPVPRTALPAGPTPITPPVAPRARSGAAGFFDQLLERISADPNLQKSLIAAGTQLLQPRAVGQTQAGAIGQAINTGFSTNEKLKAQDQRNKESKARIAQIGAQTEESRQRTAASQQLDDTRRESAQAQIALAKAQTARAVEEVKREKDLSDAELANLKARTASLEESIRASKQGKGEERLVNDLSVILGQSDPSLTPEAARIKAQLLSKTIKETPTKADFELKLNKIFAPALAGAVTEPARRAVQNDMNLALAVYVAQRADVTEALGSTAPQLHPFVVPPDTPPATNYAEGSTGTLSNGQRVIVKNGQWAPLQ